MLCTVHSIVIQALHGLEPDETAAVGSDARDAGYRWVEITVECERDTYALTSRRLELRVLDWSIRFKLWKPKARWRC